MARSRRKSSSFRKIEIAKMKSLAGLLAKLKADKEAGDPLLKNTMVLFGSNLGNASNHNTSHLPVLLAGGPFKHGQHLVAAPPEDLNVNKPLCNVFVPMLQAMRIETDKFGTSTGTLSGLEMAQT